MSFTVNFRNLIILNNLDQKFCVSCVRHQSHNLRECYLLVCSKQNTPQPAAFNTSPTANFGLATLIKPQTLLGSLSTLKNLDVFFTDRIIVVSAIFFGMGICFVQTLCYIFTKFLTSVCKFGCIF